MSSLRHIPVSEPASARTAASPDDRYLDAARDAILTVGWSRVTLTGIARRAGVSRMTLYRRWPDTRALLGDLMTREWHRLVAEVLADLPAGSTGAEHVADVVVACVAALRDDPLLRRVVDVDPEVLLPYLLHRRGRNQQQLTTVLTELVAAGQAAGGVRDGDPQLLARALVLAGQGFLLSVTTMTDPDGPDAAAFDGELRRLVARHLAP